MSSTRPPRASFVCLLATAAFVACGGRDAAQDQPDTAAATVAESDSSVPAPAPAADETGPAPLTPADIDRWEKGMAGELEAVHAAAAKLKTAKTGDDSVSAMMGVQDMTTVSAGAQAAGVDAERYHVIRTNLSAAASYLAPHVGGLDTTILSPAQREEMRQGNEAQLKQMERSVPADVVTALRPRAAELRKKDLELVIARLKGAGM